MMAADTMEALGLPRGSYVVKVNNRKVLDGVLEAIGLGGEANAGKRLTVLRAIDKLDRLGVDGVRLAARRRPQGRERRLHQRRRSRCAAPSIACWRSSSRKARTPMQRWPISRRWSRARRKAKRASMSCAQISSLTTSSDYGDDRILIDPSVVRGLEYYTGPVYEVELLLETKDEKGRPVRFGSVGGGGRYDGLVSRFRGEPVPATGFSIGVSRLQAALTMIGKLDGKAAPGPVVVTVFDRDRTADYQKMVAALRNAGIRSELYLGNPKNFGNQFKYADKRGSPCVVIQGGDEKAKGEVQIKDLILGAEIAGLSKERDDYLKKQAEAQFAVPETELVDAVRKVLARHDIRWT